MDGLLLGTAGDYFRPLVPGEYQVAIEADGYLMEIKPVNVSQKSVDEHRPVLLNFQLKPEPARIAQEPEKLEFIDEDQESQPYSNIMKQPMLSPEQVLFKTTLL